MPVDGFDLNQTSGEFNDERDPASSVLEKFGNQCLERRGSVSP
jgi:hypothetical protein